MLRALWAAARRRLGGSEDAEEPGQWYLGLTPDASIDRLEAASDVAIGLPANVGVHVVTGTASSVRRLAANSLVRWVLPRPGRHKLESTLRQFIDPTVERRDAPIPASAFSDRGNTGPDEDKLAEYISIRTLVVTLVSPRTHSRAAPAFSSSPTAAFPGISTPFAVSAPDFVAMCEAEFERRGWGTTASVVSEVRVAVHLDASTLLGGRRRQPHERRRGEAAGGELESVKSVAKWLSSRWEVLWLEPKQMFRPTIRHASKMLTVPTDHPSYQSDGMRKAVINALTNPVQTGSMDVLSVGGGATGKFCMHVNDSNKTMQIFVGANGSHPSFLDPVATAVIGEPYMRTPLHEDGLNRSVGLRLVLQGPSSPLHLRDDYLVGMQLELVTEPKEVQGEGAEEVIVPSDCYPWPMEARTFSQVARPRGCPRIITSYSAATGRVSIYPPWKTVKGRYLDGLSVRIRPLLISGQRVTVLADAHAWRSVLTLDWLKDMMSSEPEYRKVAVLTSQLHCALLPDGSAQNRVPARESLATFLQDHGFGALESSCAAGSQQHGEITVEKKLLGGAENTPCPVLCRGDRAVLELEATRGVCVYNESKIVSVQHQFGSSWCTCRYESAVLLKVEFKIPDANPLWDYGLNGSGQIVGMADTGLDSSNCLLSESDAAAQTDSNVVREVDIYTKSTDAKKELDGARLDGTYPRKVAGYHVLSSEDCALCDTCAKRIKWDRTLLFGDVAKVLEPFKTPFPHRCGDEAGAITNTKLQSQKCCGFSCPTLREAGCMNPASPCGSCTCVLNELMEQICTTEEGESCDEDNCKPCCHACGNDARLWPRRYDKFGAELSVHIQGKSEPPFDFPVKFRLYVFTREDYERYVIWSESNAGKEPSEMPTPPSCLNVGCMTARSEQKFTEGDRLKLPPSRFGYGVVIANADSASSETLVLYGLLQDGAGLQMYTAARPCGDTSDDAAGHGTFCASVAAGSVDPDAKSPAERQVARQYQGVAPGSKLFMFDMSAGSRGADNITVPLDFYTGVLEPTFARGVRILSNSWSCYFPQVVCDQLGCVPTKRDYCNSYSTVAADMDTFVFDEPEMLLLAPAGDTNVFAYDAQQESIRSPGTCKNCLSVGSSHNYHSALLQALPYMDAMDRLTAPLRAHRALCPHYLMGKEELWRKEEAASTDTEENSANEMPQTTPSGQGVSLDDFMQVEDKYAVPMECCNDDPKHNARIRGFISFYEGQLQIQKDNGLPQAVLDKTIGSINAERSKLYPCTLEPSCCILNTETKDNVLDPDDWTSAGPEHATCCKNSYQAVTRPGDALRKTDFDMDSLASFSAQGPVKDDAVTTGEESGANAPEGVMRIKPDVVAPGAYLIAANGRGASHRSRERHCFLHADREQVFDENNTLVAMGGTSVSTAAIAGAAAIVRQYLAQGFYPSGRRTSTDQLVPSAALLKAIIINSARSLSDDGSSKDAPCKTYAKGLLTQNCVPNYQEGFGRPNIASILPMAGRGLGIKQLWLADETNGFVASGWVHEYTFMVDMAGEKPILDITLVWSDPPPLPGSEIALVNDLDLVVNNTEEVGWVNGKICDIDPFTDDYFTDPKLCQKPIRDRVNNVEKTEFDVRHYLVCTYGNGKTIEFGGCKKEATLGALLSQEKDRRPMEVSVKVVAHRIQRPCISDGYYKTCSIRAQPYAVVVSGPLLVRQSDGRIHPPTFNAFKLPSNDTNTTFSGAVHSQGRGAWTMRSAFALLVLTCLHPFTYS
eukprot:Tamp_01326.p1 GENE.Tamp_01326~~Tamp_01326.p1  ORF type:complete len:1819 (-),score=331.43 Tamp_01326:83-5314(-)